jgi:hypothetical protein
LKLRKKIEKLLEKNIAVFKFDSDTAELREFIQKNIFSGSSENAKSRITKNNFPHIFYKWVKEVKPTINISQEEWQSFKKAGLLDCDFFRADMMSKNGNTIADKLKIVLERDKYKLQQEIEGRLFFSNINFTDEGGAYRRFWNRYDRPPAEEYQQYIIDRRDLLVPQNIREVKGSFFTPAIWVEKSQEYLEKAFGENWQDEYYIWDCAAGTGNLLAGLQNQYNLWASDIDQPNVDVMHALIDGGLNLLHNHVFQFDFLNDDFKKLPAELQKIIDDPEKRRKLIVYINPPYAEAANKKTPSGTGKNKSDVSASNMYTTFNTLVGTATREVFAQFFLRVYRDIPDCHLASFSTLKYINASNFEKFRNYFKAEFLKGFIIPANTFDNVNGKFPIGFLIWDLQNKKPIKKIAMDVYSKENIFLQKKNFYSYEKNKFIIDWLRNYYDKDGSRIAYLRMIGTDFQNNIGVFIANALSENDLVKHLYTLITPKNLIPMSVYYAVRKVIPADWLNDRDQFLYPDDAWEKDAEFQHNCLVYALFNNNISCKYGANHWIPFTEKEVSAKEKFESNFMSSFLKGKAFSEEAQAVLSAGKALWKYFHEKTKDSKTVSVNASFYDIREYFQGRKESGAMNVKSADEDYTALLKVLRDALKALARKIEPKVYAYGFLKE